jgi:class 3 adenylate cyclase/DNA-binding SARP family transcriptional activator
VRIPLAPMESATSPMFGLSLLGGFELTGPDGVVDLPSKKLAGLLTYLACTAPRPQSREKLSALLWGSHFDVQAKQNLRQALFRLRKILGENAIESDGEVVSLNAAAVRCDVSQFETLVREGSCDSLNVAADLYRGRLIDDVTIGEEGWSEWLTGERDRLRELALGAMVGLGKQELAAGRPERALKAGQRAIALNNIREDAHRLVVLALAAAGRKAEALRHYQHLVALLKHELNTEPDEATRSLVATLRSTQPSNGPPFARRSTDRAPAQPERPSISIVPVANMTVNAESAEARDDQASSAAAVRSDRSERRQLTIMACHIADSMALSALLDPEDLRDVITSFHKMVAGVVSRFDGFVAQYLGDGALVYFGYPAADEHDTEQAVRAGLAILDAVGTLQASPGVPLQARAGIATGLVVVGEQIGDTGQRVAIGETPDLAARLQAAASPGEMVIAAGTHRLVGRMFDCRALSASEIEGLPQSVEAWQVRGETAGVSRFEARRVGALSPLVGRQEEMDLLLRRWNQARLGEGRVVLLSGESGIGKSRIAESLLIRLKGEPHAHRRYFCSPHHAHSPLYPFIAQLKRAAGFEPGSSAKAKHDRLEALLKPAAKNVPRDVALIAELLAMPADERYPALAVSPQQKREMTLAALLDQFYGGAARSPVLIVFEDVHWLDPTSRDLLDRMVARVANLPVLLVVTFRPELQPTWVGQPHVSMLPLSRLGRRDSAAIIAGVTRDKALPDAVVEQILARTDGVPLFVEELTSTLLESGLLRETTDSYVVDGPLPLLAMPTTLQTSLVARLDRLASVKDVAQIGAAIGREFSHELIGAVSAAAPPDLDAALEQLTASGLISRRGTPPEATYSFKHALIQDAAYVTMLKSRRRQLHASIAEVLVGQFPATVERLPEIVAHHFTEAGLVREGIGYWVKAGQLAHAHWANREADQFFDRALRAIETLPETDEKLRQAMDLRFDLKRSLLPLGQFERILSYLHEAEGMARRLGDQRRLGQFSFHMCQTLGLSGKPAEALAFGQQGLALANSLEDLPLQVRGNLYVGATCLWTGDQPRAERLFLEILSALDGELSGERFGLTEFPAVSARTYLIQMYASRGDFQQGIEHGREAMRLAERLNHAYSQAAVFWSIANLHVTTGEFSHAITLLERGLAVARERNLPFLSAGQSGTLGHAYALQGRLAEGLSLLENAVNAFETIGHRFAQSLFLAPLGEAYLLADRFADALRFAELALSLAQTSGHSSGEAIALRLLGDIAARRGSLKEAESHFHNALARAEQIGMRPLVAHCHLGLSKVYLRTDKRNQARDHLAVATTMYRDMGMTYWLRLNEAEMCEPQ